MPKVKSPWVLALGLWTWVAACGSESLRAAGISCTMDSQCAAGLSCLGLVATVTDAGACNNLAKACSKACTLDSDCTAVGAKFKCFPACGGTKACGETP